MRITQDNIRRHTIFFAAATRFGGAATTLYVYSRHLVHEAIQCFITFHSVWIIIMCNSLSNSVLYCSSFHSFWVIYKSCKANKNFQCVQRFSSAFLLLLFCHHGVQPCQARTTEAKNCKLHKESACSKFAQNRGC